MAGLLGMGGALITALAACSTSYQASMSPSHPGGTPAGPASTVTQAFPKLQPEAVPANWHIAALPGRTAFLAYPPGMRSLFSDPGSVSAARTDRTGDFLLFLNATPRQGEETLANWASFRVEHVLADTASSDHLVAAATGVHFLGGIGSCVIDSYVTKAKAHHFTELACLVRGQHGASVIVAAAPTSSWAAASGLLEQAVAAYQVR